VRALKGTLCIAEIVKKVEEIIPDSKPLARKMAMYACYRYGGGKLKK
jgi:hypothetical protein